MGKGKAAEFCLKKESGVGTSLRLDCFDGKLRLGLAGPEQGASLVDELVPALAPTMPNKGQLASGSLPREGGGSYRRSQRREGIEGRQIMT